MSTMQLIVIGIFAIIILKLLFDRGVIGKGSTTGQPDISPPQPSSTNYACHMIVKNELLNFFSNILPGYKTILAAILLAITAIDVVYSFLPKWLHDVFMLSGLALGFLSLRTEQHNLHQLLSRVTGALTVLEKRITEQHQKNNNDSQSTG